MSLFVTGATGLVGASLVSRLLEEGRPLVALSRRPPREGEDRTARWIQGDPAVPGSWMREVDGVRAVVHLAGEPIAARRWSRHQKRRLVDSRVESTRCLVRAMEQASARPQVLVCASASGIYGARGEEELDESSPPGDDFLARLCTAWESAARSAETLGVRVVSLRIGVVLSPRGGALGRMLPAFRMGLGGPLGPAEHWFPWVHLDDVVGLLRLAVERSLSGPVNAVAPQPSRMGEFARTLGELVRRPSRLPLPVSLLRIPIGELAWYLSPGQKIRPGVALEAGYSFRYPSLEEALRACVS